jgi:peptidyl-prolyl cis-trans isomerase D
MVMRQMRENTKWIMLVTALAFVGLMVFQWGMDLSGRSSSQAAGGTVGSVNGEEISYQEYQTAVRNLYQQQQAQLGGAEITSAMNRQIEDAAWDQLVTNKLLEQELRRLGVRVTDDEILQAAQYAPPPEFTSSPLFQTNGEFDLQKYRQFISSGLDDQTLGQLEAYYRDVIPRSKLFFQNTAGLTVSDGQLWRMYRDANEQATIRYVALDPAALVPESEVQVTDPAVREYYDAHQADFVRPARANVKYLTMNGAPSSADSAAALQQARQVRERLAAGDSAAVVAASLAIDSAAPAARTSLTVVRNTQQFPPAFEQAAFSTALGQVSEPVQTQYGYHVLRVTSRAADTARVEQVLVPVSLGEREEEALLARVDSLEAMAEDLSLAEIGRRVGLPVQTAELMPPLAFIPGVGTAQEGVYWALEEGTRGEVSPVFEEQDVYYMLELVSRTEEGTLSLAEATPSIRSILVKQQQLEKAKSMLQQAANSARQARSLDQLAAQYRTTVVDAGPFTRSDYVPGLGRFTPPVGAAFGLQPGAISELTEAEGNLFLVQLVSRTTADRGRWQAQLAEQRSRVLQTLTNEKWQQYLTALRDGAKIVDNRRELEQQAAAAAAAAAVQ